MESFSSIDSEQETGIAIEALLPALTGEKPALPEEFPTG